MLVYERRAVTVLGALEEGFVLQTGDAGVRHTQKEPKKIAASFTSQDSQSVRGLAAFDFIDLTLSSNGSVSP